MELGGDWDYRLDAQGGAWIAYYDAARLLRLRAPDGTETLMVPEGRGQAPSGIAMAMLDDRPALLWRDKVPDKGLYLARLDRPETAPLELGAKTEPLARFHAQRFGDRLDVLWYGEAPVEGRPDHYHLYTRQLNLANGELGPIERLMPGIYPVWAMDRQGALMVMSWSAEESPQRISARFRPAGAEAFGEAVTIAEVPGITPIFRAVSVGNRWLVFWVVNDGIDDMSIQLQGAYSDDQGKTWTGVRFDDLRGFDVGSLDIVADDSGQQILLGLSGRLPGQKESVRLIRSSDQGTTWSKSQSLQGSDALERYHARNPMVAFGSKPGQVLVVWEDWRQIRSRLFASLSNDGGETWAVSNLVLPHETGANLAARFNLNALYRDGERFNLIAEQAVNDALENKHLVRLSFTADELVELAKAATAPREQEQGQGTAIDPRSEAGLRQRIDAYWQAMQEGDYTKSMKFFDPFFSARVDPIRYLSMVGRIKYSAHRVEELSIDGPSASVMTVIRASVPPFQAKTGEIIQQAERDIPLNDTWLWVDDNWYREFYSEAQEVRFTRH